jgi:hypothetical protein
MRAVQWAAVGAVAAAALVLAGVALGVGPWPGLASTVVAPGGQVRYVAGHDATSTTVYARRVGGRVIRSATFEGVFGIPAVTSTGAGGGLSPDGSLLVLAEPPTYQGLRTHSRFLLVGTKSLSLVAALDLPGEFGFDAISPDNRTLYVIQHASANDLVAYAVRAYDLRTNQLAPRAIVDRRAPDESMRGYPVRRVTSGGGAWVYTLYTRLGGPGDKPFLHALHASNRTAFCIDLPRSPPGNIWEAQLNLTSDGRQLVARLHGSVFARIDTRALRLR